MGKLLSGRYGSPPDAESAALSLQECHQKLGLKPSDWVSSGTPTLFEKAYGAKGKYLLFLVDEKEISNNPIWKSGYYLLPIEAADVLDALSRRGGALPKPGSTLPIQLSVEGTPPEEILKRAQKWGEASQPLFFKCECDHLELTLNPPWGLRRRWKARLRCPKRCQPQMTTLF